MFVIIDEKIKELERESSGVDENVFGEVIETAEELLEDFGSPFFYHIWDLIEKDMSQEPTISQIYYIESRYGEYAKNVYAEIYEGRIKEDWEKRLVSGEIAREYMYNMISRLRVSSAECGMVIGELLEFFEEYEEFYENNFSDVYDTWEEVSAYLERMYAEI